MNVGGVGAAGYSLQMMQMQQTSITQQTSGAQGGVQQASSPDDMAAQVKEANKNSVVFQLLEAMLKSDDKSSQDLAMKIIGGMLEAGTFPGQQGQGAGGSFTQIEMVSIQMVSIQIGEAGFGINADQGAGSAMLTQNGEELGTANMDVINQLGGMLQQVQNQQTNQMNQMAGIANNLMSQGYDNIQMESRSTTIAIA